MITIGTYQKRIRNSN